MITILAILCVVGAAGAIFCAATAVKGQDTRSGGKARRTAKPRADESPQHAEPTEQVEPETTSAQPAQSSTSSQDTSNEEKRIWNVPHARNANFASKARLIEEIRSTLLSRRSVSLVEPPHTPGGVGKTQAVVEYAHAFADHYKLVWWLRGSHPSMLTADCAALASEMGLRMEDASPIEVREAVRLALARTVNWLLIFDDAADPETVREYVPGGENGHILITSPVPEWWQFTVPITVTGFERMESVDMLQGRTKQTNGAIVTQLAGLLHDLPLALEHACAYMAKVGKSTTDYLTLLRSRKKEITSQIAESMDQVEVVTMTLLLSTEQARKEAAMAGDLLNLLAFFSSEGVPVNMLTESLGDLGDPKFELADPAISKGSLSALQRYSLLEVSNDQVFVHGLVQAAARARLSDDDRRIWCEKALRVVQSMFRFDARDRHSAIRCSLMLPHALAVVERVEELGIAGDVTSTLLNEVSVYLRSFGELEESKKLASKALSITEATYGSAHPRVAVCADTLGGTLHRMGDIQGARNQYERALKIDETAYGSAHPSVATRLGNLGDILRELGSPGQARVYLERALKIAEATYGPNHANVAARTASLACALGELGELREARKLLQQALTIDESVYGLAHPGVAERVHSLGVVLTRLGEFDQARACFDRALRIEQSTYGHDHPRVAMRIDYLGQVLENTGDIEGARDCYEEVLAIEEAVYGQFHPRLAARVDALGRVLERMGDFKSAKDCYVQALTIEEAAHGPEHPNVAEKIVKLGSAYRAMGDLFGAQKQYERAVEIHQNIYGPAHPEVANDLVLLGNVLNEIGDSKSARVQFGRALLIRQEHLGLTHPDTESIRKSMAGFAY